MLDLEPVPGQAELVAVEERRVGWIIGIATPVPVLQRLESAMLSEKRGPEVCLPVGIPCTRTQSSEYFRSARGNTGAREGSRSATELLEIRRELEKPPATHRVVVDSSLQNMNHHVVVKLAPRPGRQRRRKSRPLGLQTQHRISVVLALLLAQIAPAVFVSRQHSKVVSGCPTCHSVRRIAVSSVQFPWGFLARYSLIFGNEAATRSSTLSGG